MAEVNANSIAQADNNAVPNPGTVPANPATANNQINNSQEGTGSARIPDGLFNELEQNQVDQATGQLEQKEPDTLFTRVARGSVSFAELFGALPVLFTSLIMQADNIVQNEEDSSHSTLMDFLTTSIRTLSSIFRKGFDRFIPRPQNADGNYDNDSVEQNKKPFFFDDTFKRMMQPVFAKQVTSFIFALRRSIFRFMPNVFTVPAEEHDPTKPKGSLTSLVTADSFRIANALSSPVNFLSSLLNTVIAIPSHLAGAFFSYRGDQRPYDFTRFTSKISDYLMPLTTNLNSLHRVAKAFMVSWKEKIPRRLAFEKFNIGITHLIQATFGGLFAIPHSLGSFLKVKTLLTERDKNDGNFVLANHARDFISAIALEMKSMNIIPGGGIAAAQGRAFEIVDKGLTYLNEYTTTFFETVMNSTAFTKKIFSKFRPVDEATGRVLSGFSSEVIESSNSKENYVFDIFRKGDFFSELFDFFHPVQSLLMLLPNALVKLNDPYIQDNGTKLLRWADRLLGVNSMILSFPNYLIYAMKTRIPQMVIKTLEAKQRYNDINGRDYDAYTEFRYWIDKLKDSGILGSQYLAKALENMNINEDDFRNFTAVKEKCDELDAQAMEQEHSVKASELVTAFRIGLRHLIINPVARKTKLFFAERNDEGYTAEEQSRKRVYESIGTFNSTIRGIPVIGWFAAPILDIFRRFYKVEDRDRKILEGVGPRKPAANAGANPLAQMAA